MSTKEIEVRLALIASLKWDDESAHVEEKKLMADFIRYVSTLDTPLAKKAKLVLTSYEIEFQRWFA